MLSVAIPTYNRNQILLDNLKRLLPQLSSQCQLLILDNCSSTPVEETLRELLKQYPEVNCQIIRHAANIGGNANILRCIELCETPWVWILGDDDAPLPGAIAQILKHIEDHPDCTVINFSIDELRQKEWTARGVDELAHSLDGSADLPWISNSVYRSADFKVNLKFGHQYTYSMLPHVATMLTALGERGKCFFSRARIVDSQTRDEEAKPEQQWSVVNLALGFPILFDLPLRPQVRSLLARKLLFTNHRGRPQLHVLVFQLLLQAVKQRDHRSSLYFFDQICGRESAFERSPKEKLQLLLYRLAIRFPRGAARVFRVVKGHRIEDGGLQDRFDRM